jgi:tRNA pseudouridine32 synthase/23S rRNA pseudouridine746 synthase
VSGARILFEDEELVAVEKLAGMLVIPARKPEEGSTLQQLAEKQAGGKLFVVHRLDRDASGVVVFAKTAAAHKRLCALFESREARKTYRVAVLGRLEGEGRIEAPLREFGSGRVGVSPEGKPSLTLWRSLSAAGDSSLLEVGLVTGRRHQIRVHLFSIGHPVLGDALYGKDRPVGGAKRLLLHALQLELPGRAPMVCEPPADFAAELRRLGLASIS